MVELGEGGGSGGEEGGGSGGEEGGGGGGGGGVGVDATIQCKTAARPTIQRKL